MTSATVFDIFRIVLMQSNMKENDVLPADTISLVASERHRDRTRAAARGTHLAPRPFRLRAAASLRRAADRLDAGHPEPASMIPLTGRGL